MRENKKYLLLGVALIAMAATSIGHAAAITAISTDGSYNLQSVELDHNGETTVMNIGQLTRPSLVETPLDLGSTSFVINPPGDTPAQGEPRQFIESDNSLRSGFAGWANVTVQFDGNLTNRPGADIIALEFGTGDNTQVTINETTKSVPADIAWTTNLLTDVEVTAYRALNVPPENNSDIDTLTDLNNATWNADVSPTSGIAGIAIDLSDFGYSNGAQVTDLLVNFGGGDNDVDYVYIGAIIPEPATITILALTAVPCLLRRRRFSTTEL